MHEFISKLIILISYSDEEIVPYNVQCCGFASQLLGSGSQLFGSGSQLFGPGSQLFGSGSYVKKKQILRYPVRRITHQNH